MVVKGKVDLTTSTPGDDYKSDLRQALPQTLAVMVKNMLLLAYGMTIGFPTILIPSLSQERPEEAIQLNAEQISWIGSISMMCVPIGCLLSGVVTQPIGRKRSMQCGSIPIVICWIIFRYCDDVWQIYFALAFTGLSGGLLEAPVLTYVAEITQPHLRGILSSTSAFAVILGVLMEFLMGTFLNWRSVAVYSCIAPFASFILLFFVPESPHWYIMKNRMEEARKSLAWLRGWTTVAAIEEEFQELAAVEKSKDVDDENQEKFSIKLYTKRRFLCPLALVSFVFFLGHFTGMTSLQTYAVLIFSTLQVPINSYYATIFLGIAQFIGSILCVILIRYIGKRGLAFASLSISGVCFIVVATYAYLIDVKYLISIGHVASNDTAEISSNQWIPLIGLELAALAATGGIRILPWILVGEVFSRETRAIGSGIAGAISYIIGFACNKVFMQAVAVLTLPGTFWFYGFMGILGVIVLYFWLPETEGKDLLQISDHFARKSNLGNKVRGKRRSSHINGNVNEGYDDKIPEVNGRRQTESKL